MRSDALRKPIRHEVQFDVVFEQRFCSGEHKGETLGRIECVLDGLGLVPGKPLFVTLTNVVPTGRLVKIHSTGVGAP